MKITTYQINVSRAFKLETRNAPNVVNFICYFIRKKNYEMFSNVMLFKTQQETQLKITYHQFDIKSILTNAITKP